MKEIEHVVLDNGDLLFGPWLSNDNNMMDVTENVSVTLSQPLVSNLTVNDLIITDKKIISQINDKIVWSTYLASIIYCVILFLIGSPGNALVIYVYSKWRRSTSRVFIIALAVYDFLNCTVTIPTEIYIIANVIQAEHPTLCKITRFITFTMNNGSSIILLAISIDRFLRIYKPLVPPMRKRTTEIIILISIVFALCSASPSLFFFGESTSYLPVPGGKVRMKMCLINDVYKNTNGPLVFNIVYTVGTILIDIVMIIVYTYIGHQAIKAIRETRQYFPSFACSRNNSIDMSIDASHGDSGNAAQLETIHLAFKPIQQDHSCLANGNSKITEKLRNDEHRKGSQCTITSDHKHKKRFFSSEKGRKQMLKSTFMLFLVTLVFILSFIPYCAIVFTRYTQPGAYASYSTTRRAFYQLFLRSYMLSMTLNPVIYSFLSDKFRNQCKKIFTDILVKLKFLKPQMF